MGLNLNVLSMLKLGGSGGMLTQENFDIIIIFNGQHYNYGLKVTFRTIGMTSRYDSLQGMVPHSAILAHVNTR